MGVLEAGVGEPEVIQPVIEHRARNRHAEIGHVGEIRQPHAAGFLDLAEDHLLVRPMHGAPRPYAALQGAARSSGQVGMAPLHLLKDRDGAQAWRRLQHRHDLGIKEINQRIRAATATRLFLR